MDKTGGTCKGRTECTGTKTRDWTCQKYSLVLHNADKMKALDLLERFLPAHVRDIYSSAAGKATVAETRGGG